MMFLCPQVYEDWMMAPGELDGTQVTVFSAAHPSSSRKRPYIERALQVQGIVLLGLKYWLFVYLLMYMYFDIYFMSMFVSYINVYVDAVEVFLDLIVGVCIVNQPICPLRQSKEKKEIWECGDHTYFISPVVN